jgi:hypothetical protein
MVPPPPTTSSMVAMATPMFAGFEPVVGLGCACERMKEIASKEPGTYFVFDARSHKVLASVDTRVGQSGMAKSA